MYFVSVVTQLQLAIFALRQNVVPLKKDFILFHNVSYCSARSYTSQYLPYIIKISLKIASGIKLLHAMMTSSNGNIFRVTGPWCGEFTGPGEFPSPHKGQWRGTLMFSLICASINGWVNTREAGGLRRYRVHYDVIVMILLMTTTEQNNWPPEHIWMHVKVGIAVTNHTWQKKSVYVVTYGDCLEFACPLNDIES